MTVSRGGILAAAVGIIVFLLLSPDRLPRLLTGLLAALGTGVLMLALLARKGLTDRLFAAAPAGQRHSMLLIVVIVVLVVGLLQAAIALAGRRTTRPGWTRVDRRGAGVIGALLGILIVAAVAAFFASGAAHHVWEQFKQPTAASSGNSYVRLLSVAGSHRYHTGRWPCTPSKAHRGRGSGRALSSSTGPITRHWANMSSTPTRCGSRHSPNWASSGWP